MRVGRRTARLVHEAAILGFVQGVRWGQANPHVHEGRDLPKGGHIVADLLRDVQMFRDLYPTLSRVETNEDHVILLARTRTARAPESHDDAGSPGPLPAESADRPSPQD